MFIMSYVFLCIQGHFGNDRYVLWFLAQFGDDDCVPWFEGHFGNAVYVSWCMAVFVTTVSFHGFRGILVRNLLRLCQSQVTSYPSLVDRRQIYAPYINSHYFYRGGL